MTGVSLQVYADRTDHTFVEKTHVTFKELSDREINYYIDNYHPFDKAGSYGIQDWFSVCVERIEGCFYNVVGFPLARFYKVLLQVQTIMNYEEESDREGGFRET